METLKSARTTYGLALALAVGTSLFLLLSAGALGIIGDGGRADRPYALVLTVAVVGAVVARLRASGMALALLATALTMALVTVVALATGVAEDEHASVADVLAVTAMFVVLFGASAWLFRRSAELRAVPA